MDTVLPVIGGLGLFIYGMNIMGTGLQKAAGSKLKKLIEVLTNNRIMGVFIGALVTMAVQSSSATTVMVIGFVNAGIMNLTQAVGVIMGANIGTTVTAQLIAFNLTDYAPLAVAVGVAVWLSTSKKKSKTIAEILIGFGILFIGMDMMSSGLKPLAANPIFSNIILKLNNPILAMLVGIGLTTIIQSSSASIGLLQALAGQGLLGINVAFPILFGENIGTTTTALISSVGANRTAKRAAVIHFLFNLTGTIIFMTILRNPVANIVESISPGQISRQIANAHTLFNFLNVAIQLPFAGLLVKAAEKLVPGDDDIYGESNYLDDRMLEAPSIALGQAFDEFVRMGGFVEDNLIRAEKALIDGNEKEIEAVLEQEQKINRLEKEIMDYLVQLSNTSLSVEQHKDVNNLFHAINDIERIGDHAENIVELAIEKNENQLEFSEEAIEDIKNMFFKCQKIFKKSILAFKTSSELLAKEVLVIEDEVDALEKKTRNKHIKRLNIELCSTSSGVIFSDTINNLERIADHSTNLAMYVLDKYKES